MTSEPGAPGARSVSWTATATRLVSQIETAALRQVDGRGLAVFRILFGSVMLLSTLRFFAFGWIDAFYVRPQLHLKYWGFSWVVAWPAWGMYLHFAALTVLAALIALGLFYRVAIVLFFFAFSYVQLIDVSLYLNHYYLVCLLALVLSFLPAHRAWSLDARRARVRRLPEGVPAVAYWALRFQVGLVYTCAGLAKLGEDWLLAAQPLDIWLRGLTDLPVIGFLLALPGAALAFSWAGFLFDSTIVIWLSWRKTRPAAFALVVVFHTLTGLFFPIGLFPIIMITAATIFFDPAWPARLLWRARRGASQTMAAPTLPGRTAGRLALAAFGLHALVQLALPFRAHLYGGNVLWHEQGLRFSWRVLVREKNASLLYDVRAPATGRRWLVSAGRYLADHQERDIATQPDMIWQLAQHVGERFDQQGHGRVEVRADVQTSLNGRVAAPLIDPTVDLRRVTDGLASKPWILPPPPPLSPRFMASK